jgi:lipopolysaccharide biosynthesis regulator YciM
MNDTALLGVLVAGIAGLLAGRIWASSQRGDSRDRPAFRSSPHYLQGLHYLASGQIELAISELTKVAKADPSALEVQLVLGNLLREAGQVEKSIQVHQGLLARNDLTRSERIHALACVGMDHRKAGFLDRATATFQDVLEMDGRNIHALSGLQKLYEEQREWRNAYNTRTQLARMTKSDDSTVLGYLQANLGEEAARLGQRDSAEKAFQTALSLDRRVFPAHLGLAALCAEDDPQRAAGIIEEAIELVPERAYLAFEPIARIYAACGEPSRFVALCERLIQKDPRDWRARLALARHLRAEGRPEEAYGLLLRAIEASPQILIVHFEVWRTLRELGVRGEPIDRYTRTAERAVFYRDPHICTACRYRADDMLWRCPHCHEWNTLVAERPDPISAISGVA